MDENENVSSDGIHCSIGEIVVACDGRGPAVVPPLSPHLPPFPYPFRTETRSNGVLSFLPSKTSPPPCRSFTSPTLLSAPSATVSGVIGWPCILSLSVTAQACGSSSFRRREKEGRKERVSPLKKNFLSKHSISCAVVTRIFLSDRYTF